MPEVNIGLVGIGTIGSGVVKILNKNADLIEKRTGVKINLKKVCDVKLDNAKKLGLKDEQLTKNYDDLINDKISSGSRFGLACRSNAVSPAIWGAAIDVPLRFI